MFKLLLACAICVVTLTACEQQKQASAEVGAEPTYPQAAQKAGVLELGAAVSLLMPDKGAQSIDWSHRADSAVLWVTDGFATDNWANENTVTAREGLLRLNVLGSYAHVLKQRKFELAWTVRYSTISNPKFGVETITLSPGVPNEPCFGTLYDGCSFEVLPSLKKAGLTVKQICEKKEAQEYIVAYLVTHPQKKPTNVILTDSGSNIGSSSSIEMNLAASNAALCNQ